MKKENNKVIHLLKRLYKQIVKEFDITEDTFLGYFFEDSKPTKIGSPRDFIDKSDILKLLGKYKQTEKKGGRNQGEVYYTIVYFDEYDTYLKFEGIYRFHYDEVFYKGFDSLIEVKPTKKTIVVYQPTQ